MMELSDSSFSPLDIIRNKEAEVTRRLAATREAVANEIAAARQRAQEQIARAEERGRSAGEAQRHSILDDVEKEAQAIITQADAEAEVLRHITYEQMEAAVKHALDIVLGESYVETYVYNAERQKDEA